MVKLKYNLNNGTAPIFTNSKAYKIAQNKKGRVLANSEQTFGLIQLGKKNIDSAIYYLESSKETALQYAYYDIATLAEGYLMKAHSKEIQ
ncbi:MAG: hypothetical protein R2781_07380 [Flavobacteriaceae bacterium]